MNGTESIKGYDKVMTEVYQKDKAITPDKAHFSNQSMFIHPYFSENIYEAFLMSPTIHFFSWRKKKNICLDKL